jgi:hypothetical protein
VIGQLTRQVRARRCIKAAAGLYIVAALLQVLPGLSTPSETMALPNSTQADFGDLTQNVLEQTEQQLETTLQTAIYADTGCRVQLDIALLQTQTGVTAAAAQVTAEEPLPLSAEQQSEIKALLCRQLGTENVLFAGEEGGA